MNAIIFLINEHDRVKKMLTHIDETTRIEMKKSLFANLAQELLCHEQMEHQVWYPYFKNNPHITNTVKHLLKEENHAEKAIEKINRTTENTIWEECFSKFKKEVEHHAAEEEINLFPHVKKIFSEEQLKKIGKEMLEFKNNYFNQIQLNQ